MAEAGAQDSRVGMVAGSVDELLDKACKKLKVSRRGVRLFETDGTLVEDDDYLLSLPAGTVLIVASRGVSFTPDTGSECPKTCERVNPRYEACTPWHSHGGRT